MKQHYLKEELTFKNDSENENIRTRKIFEDLYDKQAKNEFILEREKDFFCTCLKLSNYENDGNPEDFEVCKDYVFKSLFLTYYSSAFGENVFIKTLRGSWYHVPEKEIIKDYKYLKRIENEW